MDQEFYRRHGMADMKDDGGANKSLSAAARRSFFRRRLKHKRSSSKDGKDLMALDAISTDSLPFTEGELHRDEPRGSGGGGRAGPVYLMTP